MGQWPGCNYQISLSLKPFGLFNFWAKFFGKADHGFVSRAARPPSQNVNSAPDATLLRVLLIDEERGLRQHPLFCRPGVDLVSKAPCLHGRIAFDQRLCFFN